MATTKITLEGKASWAKVFEENRDMVGFEGAYKPYEGAYTIQLELDEDNFNKLMATGAAKASKMKQKEVQKLGSTEIRLARKHKDRFDWASGAPKVMKADGSEWSFSDDGLIGNGSIVSVEVAVYTTSKATGTRLESVKVLDLVEYDEFKKSSPTVGGYPINTTSSEVPF